jgi:acetylornithine deacetylase/succinyl-diaminopimelate desuccinylase-like protein
VAAVVALLGPAVPAAAQGIPIALAPEAIRARAAAAAPASLALFREYLRLPNVAAMDAAIAEQVAWLENAFANRGFSVERLPTPGHPLLLAERRVADPAATVLVYLQADGQPVDPSAWDQDDPFEPVLRAPDGAGGWRDVAWRGLLGGEVDPLGEAADWRIFARSASDSKGPNIQFLRAIDLLDQAGVEPDHDVKVIVDFEEELGSPHLPAAVGRFRDRLAADLFVIFDGPPHYSGAPSLKFGARGIATFTLTTYGPRVPQHSGHYGNYAPNPAMRLAELLASMKDDRGRVVIEGFYDGVELDGETRQVLASVPDDEAEIREKLGISEPDGVGANLQEAVQYPSLNVRGLESGWVGDEVRTIVPATAVAEVDVRLVKETEGPRLLELIRSHLEAQGLHLISGRDPTDDERRRHRRIVRYDTNYSYAAFRTDFESIPGRWLTTALTRLHGEEPVRIRTSGGSIPISPFVVTLGVPAVTVPTVNADNNQHSPNENIRVGNFVEGIATIAAVLAEPLAPFVAGR